MDPHARQKMCGYRHIVHCECMLSHDYGYFDIVLAGGVDLEDGVSEDSESRFEHNFLPWGRVSLLLVGCSEWCSQ